MAMLLLTLLGYVASIALFIYSITLLNADRRLLLLVNQILDERKIDKNQMHLHYVITKSGGFGHEKLLLDLADRIAAK